MVDATENALKKFDKLANAFEVSTKDMKENIQNHLDEINNNYSFDNEIINDMCESVSNLSNDFNVMRNTLLENIKSSQTILSSFGDEIKINGANDTDPRILSAYSELLDSCNNSIKLLGSIYKDISDTHLKIKRLMNENSNNENDTQKGNSNTFIFANTADILKEFKKIQN